MSESIYIQNIIIHFYIMNLPDRKTLPHETPLWVSDDAIFFITLCTKKRGDNQLCNKTVADHLFASIEFYRSRHIWWPHLVLLMPDHIHGLFSFNPLPGMTKSFADWKHYIHRRHGIDWQRDFFDHRLRRGESYDEKVAYIRMNPVRAGLVDQAKDWPYVRESKTLVAFP